MKLISDGELLRENMARESVSEDELCAQLRQNGIDHPKGVKSAYIESDGSVSVIPASVSKPDEPEPPSHSEVPAYLEGAVRQFEAAARALEDAVADHERKGAEHRDAAKALRRTLARRRRTTPPT